MRPLTITLPDVELDRLEAEASRLGVTAEEFLTELARDGLVRRDWAARAGTALIAELAARAGELPSEDEAMALVRGELAAMRAERRAASRP